MYLVSPIRISLPSLTRIGVLCTLAALSGCASYPDWQFGERDAVETPAPSDRFALPADGADVIGDVQVTVARHKDTLHDIARRYDLGYQEIVAANPGVDPWLPGQGTQVVLPTQFVLPNGKREGLILNLASMRLYYFPKPANGEAPVVITHPIGIGREGWQTPEGLSHVTQKVVRPSWTVPASVLREYAEKGEPLEPIVPPGPDNPLGSHAMRLSIPGCLIHGTNKSYGVGMRISHGCVRLYPEDIVRLFPEVPSGTRVRIIRGLQRRVDAGEESSPTIALDMESPLRHRPCAGLENCAALPRGVRFSSKYIRVAGSSAILSRGCRNG